MDATTRGWLLATALLAAVFAAGALTGVALLQLREPEPAAGPPRVLGRPPAGRPGPGFGPPGLAGPGRRGGPGGPGAVPGGPPLLPPGLLAELELSDAQRAVVEETLQRRRTLTDRVLEELRPRLQAQLDSAHAEIRGVLTPEQRERFDAFHRELQERRPPGAPPGRPGRP